MPEAEKGPQAQPMTPTIQPLTAPPAPPAAIYAAFAGAIDPAAVQRLFQGFGGAMANNAPSVHLLFHSTGGYVGDGIALYNFFRALPLDLTLYNPGGVASIATIAYLGAKKRKTSAYATFMIHRTRSSPQFATASSLQSATKSLLLDDERTEAILRQHIKMPEDRWRELEYHDVNFSAAEAVEFGIADEIAEFAPPPGTQIFNV